jgi:hypothetical protein
MKTTSAKRKLPNPAGASFPARRRAGGALVAALVAIFLISLLHHHSTNAEAQATTPAAAKQTIDGGFLPKAATVEKPPAAINQTKAPPAVSPCLAVCQ